MLKIVSHYRPDADVTLYKGDCLDFLDELPKASVRLIVTSPPFNIGKPYETKIPLENYLRQQEEVIGKCVEKLKPNGSICWEVGNYIERNRIYPLDSLLYPVFDRLNLRLRNRIIWHYGHGLHCSQRLSGRYQTILWYTKGDEYVFNLNPIRIPQTYPGKRYFKGPRKGEYSSHPRGKNPGDVWMIPNVKANHVEKTVHPCQFPVELVERLVLSLSRRKDLVVDPYMGVGTTAVAAIRTRRRAAGSDIMSEYLEIAKQRIRMSERGELRVRPMNKPIYVPKKGSSLTRRD